MAPCPRAWACPALKRCSWRTSAPQFLCPHGCAAHWQELADARAALAAEQSRAGASGSALEAAAEEHSRAVDDLRAQLAAAMAAAERSDAAARAQAARATDVAKRAAVADTDARAARSEAAAARAEAAAARVAADAASAAAKRREEAATALQQRLMAAQAAREQLAAQLQAYTDGAGGVVAPVGAGAALADTGEAAKLAGCIWAVLPQHTRLHACHHVMCARAACLSAIDPLLGHKLCTGPLVCRGIARGSASGGTRGPRAPARARCAAVGRGGPPGA